MGQPSWSHIQLSLSESNRVRKTTRRTETSKYPEEKKENSIPVVAASETERAQTEAYGLRGCGTAMWYCWRLVERSGKSDHRR